MPDHPRDTLIFDDSDPDVFLKLSKYIVADEYDSLMENDAPAIGIDELYIVWFSKTLQNWKALVSTTRPGDGLYFEVTFSGDKNEAYVDTYYKLQNSVIATTNKKDN